MFTAKFKFHEPTFDMVASGTTLQTHDLLYSMIGKRKRETTVFHREEQASAATSDRPRAELFRKYFEARFEPLPQSTTTTSNPAKNESQESIETDEQSEDSSWEGLPEDASPPRVDVVEHQSQDVSIKDLERPFEFKSFMVPRLSEILALWASADEINRVRSLPKRP